jgi:tetratricopeptide (TPR) repeat protein
MHFFKPSFWLLLGIVLLVALLSAPVRAQNKKLMEKYLLDGDDYWEKELYFEAAQSYEKATQLNPDHPYATYQWAECQRLLFSYEAAEKGYAKVYYTGEKAYPLSLFYYALMQKIN